MREFMQINQIDLGELEEEDLLGEEELNELKKIYENQNKQRSDK